MLDQGHAGQGRRNGRDGVAAGRAGRVVEQIDRLQRPGAVFRFGRAQGQALLRAVGGNRGGCGVGAGRGLAEAVAEQAQAGIGGDNPDRIGSGDQQRAVAREQALAGVMQQAGQGGFAPAAVAEEQDRPAVHADDAGVRHQCAAVGQYPWQQLVDDQVLKRVRVQPFHRLDPDAGGIGIDQKIAQPREAQPVAVAFAGQGQGGGAVRIEPVVAPVGDRLQHGPGAAGLYEEIRASAPIGCQRQHRQGHRRLHPRGAEAVRVDGGLVHRPAPWGLLPAWSNGR